MRVTNLRTPWSSKSITVYCSLHSITVPEPYWSCETRLPGLYMNIRRGMVKRTKTRLTDPQDNGLECCCKPGILGIGQPDSAEADDTTFCPLPCYIMPPMSGGPPAGAAPFFSGISATRASVVSRSDAMEPAF